MLTHLTVKNLAIVEEVTINFGSGLNIITGETGAGKSILMGALGLVLGERADRSAIRDGATEAWVEATFSLAPQTLQSVDALLSDIALPLCEEGTLIIRRSVATSGSGRCLVNDTPATVQSLRRLGVLLVDIHGPYDHQSLLNPDFQRSVLDAYGGCTRHLEHYATHWQTLKKLEQELDALLGDTRDVAAESERLQYMLDEINQAELTPQDEDELIEQHTQVANAEEILSLGTTIADTLLDGDGAALDQLIAALHQLTELARLLPAAREWHNEVKSATIQIQELTQTITGHLSQIDADPAALQQLEARMALVQRLKRKYGASIEEVLATRDKHQLALNSLLNRTIRIEELQKELSSAEATVIKAGASLSQARKKAATRLARDITAQLQDLGFAKSGFDVQLTPAPPAPHGCDTITFGFAPNPGEPMRPLKSIASSGEIARVMLAVKTVLAVHDSIPVLVFDEIDSNIGGEVGRVVGEKLRQVATGHQVIAITHLPQSAVFGHHHFAVTKSTASGRTTTRITQLNQEQRVAEITRMLGGKGLTATIEKHARELLTLAAQSPL